MGAADHPEAVAAKGVLLVPSPRLLEQDQPVAANPIQAAAPIVDARYQARQNAVAHRLVGGEAHRVPVEGQPVIERCEIARRTDAEDIHWRNRSAGSARNRAAIAAALPN